MILFRNETKEAVTALHTRASGKGNNVYKVYKSYRDEKFSTKESVEYFTFEEALKTYMLWCGE
jgi:hypothetical protein